MESAVFVWDDSLSVGVAEIDEQHRRLVELLNEFYQGLATQQSGEALSELLTGMARYTQYHFALEERLMARHAYPGLERQRAEHELFVQRTFDMVQRQARGRMVLSLEATGFLRNWLKDHICGSDKALGRFLNERGVH